MLNLRQTHCIMTKEERIALQQERISQRSAELEQADKEREAYLQSEQYQREQWEKYQDLWEEKARKEGWHYSRKPFIGALERLQQEEIARQREIAELKERLAKLEGV